MVQRIKRGSPLILRPIIHARTGFLIREILVLLDAFLPYNGGLMSEGLEAEAAKHLYLFRLTTCDELSTITCRILQAILAIQLTPTNLRHPRWCDLQAYSKWEISRIKITT